MSLALKYRPRRFADVSGQRATVAVLHGMARKKKMPPAMLFYGNKGSGKTTSGRILAAALNCAEPPGSAATWPCGGCPECRAVANGTSLSVIEIDAASNGSVERIREIRELVQYGTAGQWRVVILDEAHSMSKDAFNAILKIIEEPPANTVFILITTEHGKILPTVASRCMPFTFGRLSPAIIADRLRAVCEAEGVSVSDELLKHMGNQADGAMRDGLMLLDQAVTVGISTLRAWQQMSGEEDFAPALLEAAVQGDHAALFAELDRVVMHSSDYSWITSQLVRCMRDILVVQAGGEVLAQGEALEARKRLAHNIETNRIVKAMSVLWDLQTRIRTEDRRSGLELAVVMVSEKLTFRKQSASSAGNGHSNGNGHSRATVEDLTAMGEFIS